jgi:hypothetical protein
LEFPLSEGWGKGKGRGEEKRNKFNQRLKLNRRKINSTNIGSSDIISVTKSKIFPPRLRFEV